MHNSISFDDALSIMLSNARQRLCATETVALAQAAGRILATDICCDIAMPPFDKSAMDGFACRAQDVSQPLCIVGEIPAGVWPEFEIGKGQCARIMTGAPLPRGADMVVMVEDTVINADGTMSCVAASKSFNICRCGEDIRAGDVVLPTGELISAAHIAVLATAGAAQVPVYVRPSVRIISTGSELVDAASMPIQAQIRNSNGPQLCAQAQVLGLSVVNCGIVPDTLAATVEAIMSARQTSDLIIISGGVSEGDYDFVPAALTQCGYNILFDSVAMQPGRPMVFAQGTCGFCCALPGNPVSTFMVFELMVKPFLYALMGHAWHARELKASLSAPFSRRNDSRQGAFPVKQVSVDTVELIDYHGSAHINAMAAADGILIVPAGIKHIEQGASVVVRCL